MRDLVIGYVFIFGMLIGLLISLAVRRRNLEGKRNDLKEELRD
jgi:hypothetical protein